MARPIISKKEKAEYVRIIDNFIKENVYPLCKKNESETTITVVTPCYKISIDKTTGRVNPEKNLDIFHRQGGCGYRVFWFDYWFEKITDHIFPTRFDELDKVNGSWLKKDLEKRKKLCTRLSKVCTIISHRLNKTGLKKAGRYESDYIRAAFKPYLKEDAFKIACRCELRPTWSTYTRILDKMEAYREVDQYARGILPFAHVLLCKNLVPADRSILGNIKNILSAKGLSKSGWKYFVSSNSSYSRLFGSLAKRPVSSYDQREEAEVFLSACKRLSSILNFLAGNNMPLSILWEFIHLSLSDVENYSPSDLAFMRAISTEALMRKATRKRTLSDLKNEIHLVYDYYTDYHVRGMYHQWRSVPLDSNQQKAAWSWWTMRSEAWHTKTLPEQIAHREKLDQQKVKRAARKLAIMTDPVVREEHLRKKAAREARAVARVVDLKAKREATTWNSTIAAPIEINNITVVPLTTGRSLAGEGVVMHHCVASYAWRCVEGNCRIFSLREKENRLATVELLKSGSSWTVIQIRGPYNNNVSNEVYAAAQELALLYTKADRAILQADSSIIDRLAA